MVLTVILIICLNVINQTVSTAQQVIKSILNYLLIALHKIVWIVSKMMEAFVTLLEANLGAISWIIQIIVQLKMDKLVTILGLAYIWLMMV